MHQSGYAEGQTREVFCISKLQGTLHQQAARDDVSWINSCKRPQLIQQAALTKYLRQIYVKQ